MENCQHQNIIVVTETPTGIKKGEKVVQLSKTFVECADCKKILPIRSIEHEEREVPLF